MQVFLSNKPIKLEIRSLILLIEEKAQGMHQNVSQQAVTQMPHITRPDTFHLTAIGQLTKDRVDEVANAPQNRTLVGCRLRRMCFAERGRIASRTICLCNRFKLHASQRMVGMFSKAIPAFPPPLETAESGVRCKNRGRLYVRQARVSQDRSLLRSFA